MLVGLTVQCTQLAGRTATSCLLLLCDGEGRGVVEIPHHVKKSFYYLTFAFENESFKS